MFDTLMVFLKEFFERGYFGKKSAEDNKSMKNYPACKELKSIVLIVVFSDYSFFIPRHFKKWGYYDVHIQNKQKQPCRTTEIEKIRKQRYDSTFLKCTEFQESYQKIPRISGIPRLLPNCNVKRGCGRSTALWSCRCAVDYYG